MRTPITLLAALSLAGCAYPATPPALAPVTTPAPPASASEVRAPVTILVSIDGFRPDYLDRGVTPNLGALAANGVTAPMRPSFPSKTFPNHWTLVTGLVPDRHGIVANAMDDPAGARARFTMATDDPWWWNTAEPIWVTAERAGVRTATMFWPGANVAWGASSDAKGRLTGAGVRPSDWQQFNGAITGRQRVDAVIDWLRRPETTRPRFVTLYFDAVDTAGHDHGPDAPGTNAAVAAVDADIGRLVAGLNALGQPANVVIVADHGMAATSSTRVVALDALADPHDYVVSETGPYATLNAVPGHEAALERRLLGVHGHVRCWRKGAIPARFRYGANPRIPAYLCLADPGWLVNKSAPTAAFAGGNHGYDNDAPAMRALFIAEGPAFVAGRTLHSFDNIDVAPLLRDLLGLPAGAGLDGDDAPFRGVLKR